MRVKRAQHRLDRRRKPKCIAVRVAGKLRIVNVCAAARWIGISHTSFTNIVRGVKCDNSEETRSLVKREYPELFEV